jgi:4-hydroxy-tetrahydrodipicolinate reductase
VRVLVLGKGKTGALAAQVARDRGHDVSTLSGKENPEGRGLTLDRLRHTDVAIDFTTPQAVIANMVRCAEARIPMVVGTTGWYQQLDKIRQLIHDRDATLVYGPNFSIGVNFFFKAVKAVGPLLKNQYGGKILERHHIHKKDKPSGTAVTLQRILEEESGARLEITSEREGETVGMHLVMLDSFNDTILLTHDAKSRMGFAEGAVRAAEWVKGKKGFYEFPEIVDEV